MSPPPTSIDGTDITGATIDGQEVQEITIDGQTVFTAGPPDFVVTQYTYEDPSNSSVSTDTVGTNDGILSGGSFNDTNPRKGSFCYDNGNNDIESESNVNLAAIGTPQECSVATFVNADSTPSDFEQCVGWGEDISNFLIVQAENGEWNARSQVNNNNVEAFSGVPVSTSNYQHVVAAMDSNDLYIIIDGTERARASHNLNIENIGSQKLFVGTGPFGGRIPGLYDNSTFADKALTEAEAQTLINQ